MAADSAAEPTSTEEKHRKGKHKRKKAKKDKWGQPLPPVADDLDHPPAEEDEAAGGTINVGRDGEEEGEGEEFDECKVVASGLPYSTTEQDIRALFAPFGDVKCLQLSRFPDTGNFRGLAFVSLQSGEAVTKSLQLDGSKIGNRYIKVERCRITSTGKKRKHGKVDGCLSAYVGNLSSQVTEDDIQKHFKDTRISCIRFASDKKTGNFRGFCHVEFHDEESLEKALQLNRSVLLGKPVKIGYALRPWT